MLSHSVDIQNGIVEIIVDGPIGRSDYDSTLAAIENTIEHGGSVKVLEIVKDIGWIDPSLWWKDTLWVISRIRNFGQCAIVTDKHWMKPLVTAFGALMPKEVKVFPLAEEEAAREWLKAAK